MTHVSQNTQLVSPLWKILYAPTGVQDLAPRVAHLFEAMRRYPKTGEPYTDADVARMSAGALTEEDVEGIRTGNVPDPTVGWVAALAGVFGVPTPCLVDRKGQPTLDTEVFAALFDEITSAILGETARLPEREKRVVLGIVRRFAEGTRMPP